MVQITVWFSVFSDFCRLLIREQETNQLVTLCEKATDNSKQHKITQE